MRWKRMNGERTATVVEEESKSHPRVFGCCGEKSLGPFLLVLSHNWLQYECFCHGETSPKLSSERPKTVGQVRPILTSKDAIPPPDAMEPLMFCTRCPSFNMSAFAFPKRYGNDPLAMLMHVALLHASRCCAACHCRLIHPSLQVPRSS